MGLWQGTVWWRCGIQVYRRDRTGLRVRIIEGSSRMEVNATTCTSGEAFDATLGGIFCELKEPLVNEEGAMLKGQRE